VSAPLTTPATLGLAVSVRELEAAYGSAVVLQDLDVDVAAGEMLALLGPSGCGKTTLLRCIAGLESPTAGSIVIGDRDVTAGKGVPPERRRVGMVFQDGALFPHRSALKNVDYGIPRGPDRSLRALAALGLVGLDAKADRMPGTLSGGEQQRVALARALAPNPGVMLLDEPFSSLDASLRVQLRDEVRRLLTDLGITGVLVTHDQQEALAFGHRVGVMRAGRLEQLGAPEEIYARPASPWVARFVGEATLLPAELRGTTAETALGRIDIAPTATGPGTVMLRPEQVTIADGSDATVRAVDYLGALTRYELVAPPAAGPGDAEPQRVVATVPGPPTRAVGDRVGIRVTVAAAHAWAGDQTP
jgi:ABC-type Fe3+/spermidine/putrescine transport system ATPase subunit